MGARRWAVLISGRGSNMVRFLETALDPVALVMTSNAAAPGVARARRRGVAVVTVPFAESAQPKKARIDWAGVDEVLNHYRITHLFLLGFMRIIPSAFLQNWRGTIWNLHPSILPLYPGLRSIERAVADGAACGVTIHEVVSEVDAGAVILQRVACSARRHQSLDAVERLMHIEEQRALEAVARRPRFGGRT